MKKFLALMLTLVCVMSLAACGEKTEPAADPAAPAAPSAASAWTSAADLEGKKIAVQEGTTGDALVSEITSAEISRFKAVTACGMELLNGRVDCVVVDSLPAQKLVDVNPDKLMLLDFAASEGKEAYAIGVQKNDAGAALAAEFNAAMKSLKDDGTFDLLVQKHISGEDVTLPELPAYTSKGTLIMGTNAEFEPFEYVGDDGEYAGFDIDFAKFLCATMGYDLQIENMDFDALPAALQSGKVNFLAAGLSITEEKLLAMNFTDEYYEATQAIVVLK
ncbi:MAG: transporter substrate-binding domain-containing protein [Oscillibacter sp.]